MIFSVRFPPNHNSCICGLSIFKKCSSEIYLLYLITLIFLCGLSYLTWRKDETCVRVINLDKWLLEMRKVRYSNRHHDKLHKSHFDNPSLIHTGTCGDLLLLFHWFIPTNKMPVVRHTYHSVHFDQFLITNKSNNKKHCK